MRAITAILVTIVAVVLVASFKAHAPAAGTLPVASSGSSSRNGSQSASTSASGGEDSGGGEEGGGSASSGSSTASSSSGSGASTSSGGSSSSSGSAAKSGTGDAVDTGYGVVQVRVTMRGGKVADVQTVQMTANDGQSQSIHDQAEPILHQEALQARSASIQVVSGASYTSEGYIQSLQSAIDRARA